ncbi:hypothetical protein G7Y89_g12744 [Cudoniella acicularis]|uniref:Fungal N-terminal domain-containing protein n=1 Tax=Cudoniella acicularis TaxID=354080 RepID=A0A8H4VWP4_9HELO|nr:hypothetical protein G7Y89_g12744 [Cudoniella acicularis]
MSGLEILGGLASAAQIAVYAVKAASFLSDIHERLKKAPERIQQHASSIKRLIDIILHIQETHSLHTTIVFTQLNHTISRAFDLRDLLVKVLGEYTQPSFRRRYWKLLKGRKEKQILAALQSLEREKTGLSLCLTTVQTELLHDVRREVKIAGSDMSVESSKRIPRDHLLPSPAPTSTNSNPVPKNESLDKESSDTEMTDIPSPDLVMAAAEGNNTIKVEDPLCEKGKNQVNGIYAVDSAVVVRTNFHILRPKASGKGGVQVNGIAGEGAFN